LLAGIVRNVIAGTHDNIAIRIGEGIERGAQQAIMKPLQGVSFDIGTKRAVSYFLSDGDTCKLTLMLAEVVYGDEVNGIQRPKRTFHRPFIRPDFALPSWFHWGSTGCFISPDTPSAGLHGLARLLTLRPMDNVMNIDRHCTTWT
jgi:hypothetical protein